MAASLQAIDTDLALKEVLSHSGITEAELDKECPPSIRYDIAIKIINWKMIGRHLGIPPEKLVAIEKDNGSEEERRVCLLDTWHQREGSSATYLCLINAFVKQGRRDLAESLCTMIKGLNTVAMLPGEKRVIDRRQELERGFQSLQDQLKKELMDKNIPVDEVLHSLTRLPLDLKLEHDEIIESKLPKAIKARNISQLFFRLNPLFSFIDYKLLNHLISEFGSTKLKADAATYVHEIQIFMRETTVGDVLPYWPGKKLSSEDFTELWVKITDDPKKYTLENLNQLRNKHSANLKFSAVLSAIVNLTPAGSFFAVWTVPIVAINEVRRGIHQMDRAFYESEHINMIILDNKLVYLSNSVEAIPTPHIHESPGSGRYKTQGINHAEELETHLQHILKSETAKKNIGVENVLYSALHLKHQHKEIAKTNSNLLKAANVHAHIHVDTHTSFLNSLVLSLKLMKNAMKKAYSRL